VTILSNTLTVADGGLGIATAGNKPVAVIGTCSAGTTATPTAVDTIDGLVSTFGYGPMCEDAAAILSLAGGPVYCVRAATATAAALGGMCQRGGGSGSAGTLAAAGGNTSTAVPALTGTPDAPYAVKIVVTTAGSNLAASPVVKVSLDGGLTYLATGSIAASATPQAIGTTGLSLAWTDGTFVLNESWSAVGANCPTDADATGTSVPVFSGTPLDAFDIRVDVTTAGSSLSALTATVKVSLDGGRSYGPNVQIPASGVYAIPNTGVTVTFGSGTLVVGDSFRIKTSAPLWDVTSLAAALASLTSVVGRYEFAHVAGPVDRTSAGTAKTWATDRQTAGEYVFAQLGCRDQYTGESITTWSAAIQGTDPGFSGYDGGRYLDVCATHGYVASYLRAGVYFRRNLAVLRSARLASIPARQHPGRVKSGPIQGLMPDTDALAGVIHDLATYTSLDNARFSGAQQVKGRPRGEWYFTSRTMSVSTSDFGEVQRIRVMCLAATAALTALAEYVGDDVETKTDGTGQIAEAAAQAIDGEVTAKLKLAVVRAPNDHATRVTARTVRTNNLLSTGTLQCAISVVPRGSVNAVSTTISYTLTASA
jgi:hypothetical protein